MSSNKAVLTDEKIDNFASKWTKEDGLYEFDRNDFHSCARAIEAAVLESADKNTITEPNKSQERDYKWLLSLAQSKGYPTVYSALYATPASADNPSTSEHIAMWLRRQANAEKDPAKRAVFIEAHNAARKIIREQVAADNPSTAGAGKDLHDAIMNIPCQREDASFLNMASRLLYKEGHRDARHAAAELALAVGAAPVAQSTAGAAKGGIASLEALPKYEMGAHPICFAPGAYYAAADVERLLAAPAAQAPAQVPTAAEVPSQWVNVADGVPKHSKDGAASVWASWSGAVGFPSGPRQGEARYIESLGWQPYGCTGWDWNVTHWMPLPAAPEQSALGTTSKDQSSALGEKGGDDE